MASFLVNCWNGSGTSMAMCKSFALHSRQISWMLQMLVCKLVKSVFKLQCNNVLVIFELVLVHLVRGNAEMRDEVGTAMRPWTILNMVVSVWFFQQCSRVSHCRFSSITDTLLCCLWSPDTNLAALRFTLSTLSICFWRWGVRDCTAILQDRPHHCEICDLLRLFWAVL